MVDAVSTFQKLWIIESLPPGELRTGRNLYENEMPIARTQWPDLEAELVVPKTRSEFLAVLRRIRDDVLSRGAYPMIHIDCHGSPHGIQLANRDVLGWDALRLPFIAINEACRLNLVTVLAACEGVNLIRVASKLDRAPFWAIIAPSQAMKAGDLETDFGAFYRTFFERLDGDAAMSALRARYVNTPQPYYFLSAEGIFLRAYGKYYVGYCTGKGKRARVESLVTAVRASPRSSELGVGRIRELTKAGLADSAQAFDELKQRFFMIDLFPENAARFTTTYTAALDFAKEMSLPKRVGKGLSS